MVIWTSQNGDFDLNPKYPNTWWNIKKRWFHPKKNTWSVRSDFQRSVLWNHKRCCLKQHRKSTKGAAGGLFSTNSWAIEPCNNHGDSGKHQQIDNVTSTGSICISTWWLIPLCKWVRIPVINGISRVNPLITGVITHLLSGTSHQVVCVALSYACQLKSSFLAG